MEITFEFASSLLPARQETAHKGSFGRDLIWGGSVGLTGAPCLAAEGALRMGAGLVHVAALPEIYPILACKLTCAMPFPADTSKEILEKAALCDGVLIGCGLGRELDSMIRTVAGQIKKPLILDADGINAFAGHIDKLPTGAILTPHEGEFLRLGGSLAEGREWGALRLAEKTGCIIVLKGHRTVIAHPDGTCYVNPTGNAGMAKGGSGDVLAGMILALLGQGVPPERAAAAAVYFHGLAGDLCRDTIGIHSFLPTDLLSAIGKAVHRNEAP